MKEAPFREISVPNDSRSADANAARAKLKAVMDQLLAEDKGEGITPKKKKKQA